MTTAGSATTRAGDRDRATTADQLAQALAQGYLDMPEYEQRVSAAYAARTANELRQLTTDLPVATLRRDDPRRQAARAAGARKSVHFHLAAYLVMVVVVLTVWLSVALSGGGWYFWPVWPMLGAGIGVLGHAIPIALTTRGAR